MEAQNPATKARYTNIVTQRGEMMGLCYATTADGVYSYISQAAQPHNCHRLIAGLFGHA